MLKCNCFFKSQIFIKVSKYVMGAFCAIKHPDSGLYCPKLGFKSVGLKYSIEKKQVKKLKKSQTYLPF